MTTSGELQQSRVAVVRSPDATTADRLRCSPGLPRCRPAVVPSLEATAVTRLCCSSPPGQRGPGVPRPAPRSRALPHGSRTPRRSVTNPAKFSLAGPSQSVAVPLTRQSVRRRPDRTCAPRWSASSAWEPQEDESRRQRLSRPPTAPLPSWRRSRSTTAATVSPASRRRAGSQAAGSTAAFLVLLQRHRSGNGASNGC
jgi:hypothetical protein